MWLLWQLAATSTGEEEHVKDYRNRLLCPEPAAVTIWWRRTVEEPGESFVSVGTCGLLEPSSKRIWLLWPSIQCFFLLFSLRRTRIIDLLQCMLLLNLSEMMNDEEIMLVWLCGYGPVSLWHLHLLGALHVDDNLLFCSFFFLFHFWFSSGSDHTLFRLSEIQNIVFTLFRLQTRRWGPSLYRSKPWKRSALIDNSLFLRGK